MRFYSEHYLLKMRMNEGKKKKEFILNMNKEINRAVYGPKERKKVLRRFVKQSNMQQGLVHIHHKEEKKKS